MALINALKRSSQDEEIDRERKSRVISITFIICMYESKFQCIHPWSLSFWFLGIIYHVLLL